MDDVGLLNPSDQHFERHLVDDIQLLTRATLNEQNSPEILQYQEDLLNRLEQSLKLQVLCCEDLEQDMNQEIKRMMLSLEVRRVRYLIKLYYKTRLAKIEKLAASILDDEELASRLSDKEHTFAKDYFVMLHGHLQDTVLKHMPREYKSVVQVNTELSQGNDLIKQPLLDTHVFCKLLQDAGSVSLDEGQSVEMQADDLFMVRYRVIRDLVANQQAVLI